MPQINPQNTTSIIDAAADRPALVASLRQLTADARHRLTDALNDIADGETDQAIVDNVRTMMTALYPDRPVRGVVFRYDTYGDVLFESGTSAIDVSLGDVYASGMVDLLNSVCARVAGSPMIAVDLRAQTVTTPYPRHGAYRIHRIFGEPEPK